MYPKTLRTAQEAQERSTPQNREDKEYTGILRSRKGDASRRAGLWESYRSRRRRAWRTLSKGPSGSALSTAPLHATATTCRANLATLNVPRTRRPTSAGHALRAPEREILTGFVLGPSNPRLARPARQPDFTGDRHRIPWTRRSVLSIAAPGEPLHGPDVRRRGGQPQNRRRRPGNFGFAGRRRRTSGRQESRTQPSASIDSFRPALCTPAMKQRLAMEAKSAPLRREKFQATLRRGSGSR